jgi:hypothetical protein
MTGEWRYQHSVIAEAFDDYWKEQLDGLERNAKADFNSCNISRLLTSWVELLEATNFAYPK